MKTFFIIAFCFVVIVTIITSVFCFLIGLKVAEKIIMRIVF